MYQPREELEEDEDGVEDDGEVEDGLEDDGEVEDGLEEEGVDEDGVDDDGVEEDGLEEEELEGDELALHALVQDVMSVYIPVGLVTQVPPPYVLHAKRVGEDEVAEGTSCPRIESESSPRVWIITATAAINMVVATATAK